MEAFAIILMIFSFILAPHRVAAKIARVPVALLIALIHVMFKNKTKNEKPHTYTEKTEAPYVAYVNTDGVVYEFFIPRRIIALYRRIKNLVTNLFSRSDRYEAK
tara:strand:- start:22 stop:333 length:312 start_codon:yes stop_codon:yes gene_type:complete